jgi:phosphoglycerol geranylgeranyltransferase
LRNLNRNISELPNTTIYQKILSSKGSIAILIDPDKFVRHSNVASFIDKIKFAQPDFIFIGGSTVSRSDFQNAFSQLERELSGIPKVIFPGASHHIDERADAILFLSLLSGRNPDFLIGHHIEAAEEIAQMNVEVIPTSYLLIDGGKKTSVEYVSQTTPIPNDQYGIGRKTALAGKLQGKKITYIDCGSGALVAANDAMIQAVKSAGNPLIVGGGIRTIEEIRRVQNAGANVVVIGNKIEEEVDFLLDLAEFQKQNHVVD